MLIGFSSIQAHMHETHFNSDPEWTEIFVLRYRIFWLNA